MHDYSTIILYTIIELILKMGDDATRNWARSGRIQKLHPFLAQSIDLSAYETGERTSTTRKIREKHS